MFGVPHLVGDEIVTCSIQTAADVRQTHSDLYEQADVGLGTAVLNHTLVHLYDIVSEKKIVRHGKLNTKLKHLIRKAYFTIYLCHNGCFLCFYGHSFL